MPKRKLDRHWGAWILARARFLGFKRQEDIAFEVGCTRQHLAKWAKMPSPPKHMRRGLDQGLARALKVDRMQLFSDWTELDPEHAPVVDTPLTEGVPWNAYRPDDDPVRIELQSVLRGLTTDDLKELLEHAAKLAQQRMAAFEAQLDQSMQRLGVGPYAATKKTKKT